MHQSDIWANMLIFDYGRAFPDKLISFTARSLHLPILMEGLNS